MEKITKTFGLTTAIILTICSIVTAINTPTASPSGFKLIWTDAFTAKLQWNKMNDVLGYNLSLCNVMRGCKWSLVINVTTEDSSPDIVINNLEANNLYKTKFAAFNEKGTGPWSSDDWSSSEPGIFMFNTQNPPPYIAPTKVKVWVKDRNVEVKWQKPELVFAKINGYRVEAWLQNETVKDALRFDTIKDGQDEKISFNLSYSNYNVWVRAFNSGGGGKPSGILQISTQKGKKAMYGGGGSQTIAASLLTMTSSVLLLLLSHYLF